MPQKYTKKQRAKKVKRIVKKMDLAKVRGDEYGKHLRDIIRENAKALDKLKKSDESMNRKIMKMGKGAGKKLVGKTLAKAIPGVGAAIIARDVVKGISKATCSKRGGKWVSGKCKGVKKDTRKITSPAARDLKSKR